MRILVVDDDKDIRGYLKANLEAECFAVDTAGDGEEGAFLGKNKDYDAIVLDNNMPRKSGISVCAELRKEGKVTPIIMLSVESDTDQKAQTLDIGADDYITKPFSYKELRSRIRAILRRPNKSIPSSLEVGDVALNALSQTVRRGRKNIYLTRKEFALLEYLMRNEGQSVSKAELIEHVWDDEVNIFSNTLEAHILNLRKKLGCRSGREIIHTMPGRGYMASLACPN